LLNRQLFIYALGNKDIGGLRCILSTVKINWKEFWRKQVVDYFKILPLNSPGMNERINEVQRFIIVFPVKFGNESCLNTNKNSHSEPISSLLSNRI